MRFAPGLAPLRHRDFALYFSGLTVSQCGSWMEQTLTTWLLYEITGSPVLLGIAGALRAIPIFVVPGVAGIVEDGAQGFEVGVDVRQDRVLHALRRRGAVPGEYGPGLH